MITRKYQRAKWWMLGVLVPLMVGLLMLAHHLAPSPAWRPVLEVGVLLFSYGLIELWLRLNRVSFLRDRAGEYISEVTELETRTIYVLPSKPQRRYTFEKKQL
jgi:hypothetical protein